MHRSVWSLTLITCALSSGLGACASTATQSAAAPAAGSPAMSEHNSKAAGVYLGTTPCADCQGIQTSLLLRADGTYQLATKYLGKPGELQVTHGKAAWNAEGNQITLTGVTDGANRYLVAEDRLTQLDLSGQRITGDLADKYVLLRQGARAPAAAPALSVPSSWVLVELNGKPVPANTAQPATLAFAADSNRVSGYSGCNNFSGAYTLSDGNRLRFGPMAMTRRACPEMSMETEYAKVLESTDGFAVRGDTLLLHRARMTPLARFRRQDPR